MIYACTGNVLQRNTEGDTEPQITNGTLALYPLDLGVYLRSDFYHLSLALPANLRLGPRLGVAMIVGSR